VKRALIVSLIVAALLILIPVLAPLFPSQLTVEGIEEGMIGHGFTIGNEQTVDPPEAGAITQKAMTVNGADAYLYQFDSELKLEAQRKLLKSSFGDDSVARNQMFLLAVVTFNDDLRRRVCRAFESL